MAQKAFFDEQLRNWIDMGSNISEMAKKTMSEVPPFKPFFDFFSESTEKKNMKEDEN